MTRINLSQNPLCPRCDEERWYRCGACAKRVCVCTGCADEYPELCDRCWSVVIGNVSVVCLSYLDDKSPEGLAREQIRLMKLMFEHGTL